MSKNFNIFPKFAIGDKFWAIRNHKAQEVEVKVVVIDSPDNKISYGDSVYDLTPEAYCYASKEELIKSL